MNLNQFLLIFAFLFSFIKCSIPLYYATTCYDGSQVIDPIFCPNPNNGCPFFAPYRCSNGICIANYRNCPRVKCADNEVVCNDGSCHSNEDDCANINVFGCPGGLIRCINGKCLQSCEFEENKCSAKDSIQCPSGQCAMPGNNENCMILPDELYTYCDQLAYQYDSKKQVKLKPCADGSCVHVSSECPVLNQDSVSSYYPCGDKTYRSSTKNCPAACPMGLTRCPNGLCTKGHCAFQRTNPVTENPRTALCADDQNYCLGECTTRNCSRKAQVPLYACPDDTSFAYTPFSPFSDTWAISCKPTIKCPMDRQYICPGFSCAKDSNSCPPTVCSGYRCTNGKCVENENDCQYEDYACPEDIPVLCASGHCVETPQECKKTLYNLWLPMYNTYCKSPTPYRCHDGSCANNPYNCIVVANSCDPLKFPHRCTNGDCVESSDKCPKSYGNCPLGQTLCLDGTCQITCLPINGCPIDRPYQCPNGACGLSASECAARSGCPVERPFQCTSMKCMQYPSQCETPAWSLKPMNLMITMNSQLASAYDISKENTLNAYIKLAIPSGTQVCTDRICYGQVIVRPVADSILRKLWIMTDSNRANYIREKIHSGYENLDGMTLIKSPVFNISGINGGYLFSNPIRIELYTDISNKNDLCLAIANLPSNTWSCDQKITNYTANSAIFWIKLTGIYALIYYPEYKEMQNEIKCRWPANEPKWYILSVIGCSLLVIFIVLALWWVHHSKQKNKEIRERVVTSQSFLEEISTGKAKLMKSGNNSKLIEENNTEIKKKLDFSPIEEKRRGEEYFYNDFK